MKTDEQILVRKEGLKGAVEALKRGPVDDEGRTSLSRDGVIELLEEGIDSIDELERLRKAAGPSYLNQIEVVVDGLEKAKP